MTSQPTGTVTFLFTDIEGSTRLWQRDAQRMAVAQAAHDRILRSRIAEHGGFVFSSAGDGIGAAFSTPGDTLAAAIAVQIDLAAEPWPDDTTVTVRMGLHTGHAEERDGDYFGHEVNKSARVMSVGHGGQILLSSAAAELVRSGLGDGLRVDHLGEHRLKDIAEPVSVLQLVHPDLRSDFPPLNTGQQVRGNLPASTGALIGRDHDVTDLVDALADARALTLFGPGGVGKTRLALEVASRFAPRVPGGAWLVELAMIGEDSLWFAIAGMFGIRERPDLGIEGSVLDWLRSRHVLLLLDNAEHVIDAVASAVEKIVRACPDVTVLVTSREALGISSEQVHRLRPLALVSADDEVPPAVALFLERARAVARQLPDDDATRRAIHSIVEQLDGLPLAIELAAAQTRALSPANIAKRLSERFRLLSSGRRASVERHQTLRATVDWSYGLLTAERQALFDRLSVFVGGFSLESAEKVGSGDDLDEAEVFPLLADLVDKSMVAVDHAGDETRYSLLETLRTYGAEKLVERGEAEQAGDRHTAEFVRVAHAINAGMLSPDEPEWRARFWLEFDNLRSAFHRSLQSGDLETASIICDRVVLNVGLEAAEVLVWPRHIVDEARAAGEPVPVRLLPTMMAGYGSRGDFEVGRALAAEQLARTDIDPQTRNALLAGSALIHFFSGELEECVALLVAAREGGVAEPQYQLYLMSDACVALSYLGRHEEAQVELELYRQVVEGVDSPTGWAYYEYCAGEMLSNVRPLDAVNHLRKAVEHSRAGGGRFAEGIALVTLASILGRHGEPRPALEAMRDAIDFFMESGNRPQVWTGVRNLVELLCRIEASDDAAVLWGAQAHAEGASALFGDGAERLADAHDELEKRLGSDAFDAACRRGAALTETETTAYAFAAIDRLLSSLP